MANDKYIMDWVYIFWVYFLRALDDSRDKRAKRSALNRFKAELKDQYTPGRTAMENLKAILLGPPLLKPDSVHRRIVQWFYLGDFRSRYTLPTNLSAFYEKETMHRSVLQFVIRENPRKQTYKVLPMVDPKTGSRLRVPVRYFDCYHVECFEGDVPVLPDSCPFCNSPRTKAFVDTAYVAIIAKSHWRCKEAYLYPDITVAFPQKDPTGEQILSSFRQRALAVPLPCINQNLYTKQRLLDISDTHHALVKAELNQSEETMLYSGFKD